MEVHEKHILSLIGCFVFFFFFHLANDSFLLQTQIVSDETWKLVDDIWDKKVQEMSQEVSKEIEEDEEKPQLLMASHFL